MEPTIAPNAKRRPMSEINVVPYIDVMLVLLIIFMVAAPMLVQTVPVALPKVESTPSQIEPDDNTIVVTVDSQGLYYIERDNMSDVPMGLLDVQDYVGKITAEVPATRIMIRGDDAVAYGRVVVLMGSLQAIGIQNVGLITEAPDPEARR